MSVTFGLKKECSPNAPDSNVLLGVQTAAADVSYSISLTSWLRNQSLKNSMRGHICDFYLKFHCELNFIEQYWGAVKYLYQSTAKTADMDAMERNVLVCLDEVPLLQIRRYVTKKKCRGSAELDHRYVNRSARFISAYAQGLSGSEVVWANRKYHGHRTLPAHIVQDIENAL